MKSGKLWASMVVLLLSAAPALAVQNNPAPTISPATTDAVENSYPTKIQLNAGVQGNDAGCTYSWSQTVGPPALNQTNGNGGAKHWEFTTPSVDANTSLTFQVTVSGCVDSTKNGTATAIVNVSNSLSNSAPVAAAAVLIPAPPAAIFEGDTVTLDASASSDPDNDALTYQWEQVDGPTVTLSSTTAAKPTFIAPNNASSASGSTLQFKLTVSDGTLFNSTNLTVNVKWVNDPPKAALSCPKVEVDERADFKLDGSGSTDTDDGIDTYGWSQTYGGPHVDGLPSVGTGDSISLVAPSLTSIYKKVTFEIKVTDKSGAYDTTTCDVTVHDITPPVFSNVPANITAEAQSASGAAVPFTMPTATDAVDGDRTVTCDPASGDTFALDQTTTVKCSASDASNNSAETSFTVKVVDTTPPALNLPGPIGPIEGNTLGGANNINYAASANDLVDGPVTVTCNKASGSLFPVGTTTVACSTTDAHSNTKTGSFDVVVQDTTAPVITFGGSIVGGSSFYFGSVPAAPTCTAYDVVSGSTPCTVNGYSTSVGTHALIATATDIAGNKATENRSYTVLPWTLNGFYSPIDMNGVTNTVKGGSTVPMKFEVFVGPTELTSTASISSIKTLPVSCGNMSAAEDAVPVDALATGGTMLRYDTTGGQFIYNWQTTKSPGTCYIVTVTTLDGSMISANFKLK